MVRPPTGGRHQGARFVLAVELALAGPRLHRRLPVRRHAGRHEGRAGQHDAAPDGLGQELAVDHHGERLAHPFVVERRVADVEGEEIGAEIRRDPEVGAQMRAPPGDLVDGHVVVGVDLAGHEPAQRRRAIVERQDLLAVERDMRGVVEVRVLRQHQPVVRRVAREREGAVADEAPGAREGIAPAFHAGAVDGQRGEMRELRQQVCRGMLEPQLEGEGIEQAHAERGRAGQPLAEAYPQRHHRRMIEVAGLQHARPDAVIGLVGRQRRQGRNEQAQAGQRGERGALDQRRTRQRPVGAGDGTRRAVHRLRQTRVAETA